MDLNLILSAQTLCLAPQLQHSEKVNGLLVLKNVPARTYLRVTPEQWVILEQFENPRTVPSVLNSIILDRKCLPLGEFYELILRALRMHILLEPGPGPTVIPARPWLLKIRPQWLHHPLIVLFCVGMVLALGFRPRLPATWLDVAAGLALLSAALSLGAVLMASVIRGAGGEVYRPRWRWLALPPYFDLDASDAVILPIEAQEAVGLARPALLAVTAGLADWHRPEWTLFPLLGLIVTLRPIFGGHISNLIHLGRARGACDVEQSYLFPPNQRPGARLHLLANALRQPTTWAKIAYGVVWTIAILYWGTRFTTHMLPWSVAFWEVHGERAALGIGSSLSVLIIAYLGWEVFLFLHDHMRALRHALRLWHTRWLGRAKLVPDETSRIKVLAAAPLFGTLHPPEHQELARLMQVTRHGLWMSLPDHAREPTRVSLIVSGKISLRRELPSGRKVRAQILAEGDVLGLHDLADPKFPHYHLRSLTPVTLLTMDRAAAEELIARRISRDTLTNLAFKLPFLRGISLCRTWEPQAIERFANLAAITDYADGDVIISESQAVQDFFVIFQGVARVTQHGKRVGKLRAGGFFGEIGLMQNSMPNATVTAHRGVRCLSISRVEFMRFVTHNYTAALELERVSSERLGHPLFPLKEGDFRAL